VVARKKRGAHSGRLGRDPSIGAIAIGAWARLRPLDELRMTTVGGGSRCWARFRPFDELRMTTEGARPRSMQRLQVEHADLVAGTLGEPDRAVRAGGDQGR